MSDPSTSSPSGGVSRFVGVGLSLVTGFVVFTVGVSLFPIEPPRPPEPARRPVIAQAATPASPPEPSPSPSGVGGAPAAAGTADRAATDGGAAPAALVPDGGGRPLETGSRPSPAGKPERAAMKVAAAPAKAPAPSARAEDASTGDAETTPAATDAGPDGGGNGGATGSASADDAEAGTQPAPVADCTQSDKDIAREASRHNWPTVCAVADSKGDTKKAFLIIPVKGSIDNAASELKRKPIREARVTLPSGESQLSLKQYKLRRLGFRDLKIGPPDEGSGTRFRVRFMNGAGDPAFEIKDGYAKITVLAPSE